MITFFSFVRNSLFLIACSFAASHAVAQEDSLRVADSTMDCFDHFFDQAEKPSQPNKIILVTQAGKTISLANFIKPPGMGEEINHGLADLDHDGKKELVVYQYTGGAHCCDEFYLFKNIGPNKFQFAAKTFAGDVCITGTNKFIFNFYQQFGYFFTCFACGYDDSTESAPIPVSNIVLKYSKGKLLVVPGDKELKSQINDNLAKLGEQPYEKLEDDAAQDNGLRKEFALNLAVYYYSFGKNLVETKMLFDKYYKYPDAKKVWSAFAKQIAAVRTENKF